MYSLALTIRSLRKGESLTDLDPQRLKQAKLMLHDLLMAMLSILFGMFLYNKSLDGKSNYAEMGQYEQKGAKIMMRSLKEFNPFSVFGDIQTTPAFISKVSTTLTDFKGLFTGDTDIDRLFRHNVNFLELVPNPMVRN